MRYLNILIDLEHPALQTKNLITGETELAEYKVAKAIGDLTTRIRKGEVKCPDLLWASLEDRTNAVGLVYLSNDKPDIDAPDLINAPELSATQSGIVT